MKTVHTMAELVREAKTGPVALEVEGSRFVVQDEASYEEDRFVASLIQAEKDYEAGLGMSVDEVRAFLQAKHGF